MSFDNPQHHQACRQDAQPFIPANRGRLENGVQERQVGDGGLEEQNTRDAQPEPAVAEQADG